MAAPNGLLDIGLLCAESNRFPVELVVSEANSDLGLSLVRIKVKKKAVFG